MHVSHVSNPNFPHARTYKSYGSKRAERAREDVSAGQEAYTTICACGHHERIHSVLEGTECRVCPCEAFTPAQDATAATEAARATGEAREAAYNALRRAVANYRLDDARRILEELLEGAR